VPVSPALKAIVIAAALASLGIGPVRADPPPPGSEQDAILSPHGGWIRGLMNPFLRQGCCDLSDCRAVTARVRDGHYQVFVGRKEFGGDAPDIWLDVPDEVVLHERVNPVGLPIACWRASRQPLYNGFFCFQDGTAT
jgi:hypothetical protein